MPSELRFCRNCGFRLGEGLAEYTETVRFGGERGAVMPGAVSASVPVKKRKRMSGMAWIFVGLLVFFIGAAAFTAIISPMREHVNISRPVVVKSYAGVESWETTDNGVTFSHVHPPGGPADKAGLVGGDVVTKVDGQRVVDEDEMNEVMTRTPVGKTVDVEYIRDGETRTTKLTTVSLEEFRQLDKAFDDRPEGRGQFGYEDSEAERVEIPGTKMHGVKLNRILASRPADLAGIKTGDVVIEFDGIPIRTSDEFLMRVRRAIPYSTVKVVVMRDNERVEIPVKMGRQ